VRRFHLLYFIYSCHEQTQCDRYTVNTVVVSHY